MVMSLFVCFGKEQRGGGGGGGRLRARELSVNRELGRKQSNHKTDQSMKTNQFARLLGQMQ